MGGDGSGLLQRGGGVLTKLLPLAINFHWRARDGSTNLVSVRDREEPLCFHLATLQFDRQRDPEYCSREFGSRLRKAMRAGKI
jgi:hypothetical protein